MADQSHPRENVSLPLAPANPVPVFDCHVILTPPSGEQTSFQVRAANLAGLSGSGPTERDALLKIVASFKRTMIEHAESNTPIPWIHPPEQPADGEMERWIPVHL